MSMYYSNRFELEMQFFHTRCGESHALFLVERTIHEYLRL